MSALAVLAERIAWRNATALSGAVADATRRRVFDTLGATAIGLATAEGRMLGDVFGHRAAAGSGSRAHGQAAGADLSAGSDHCRLLIGATRATEVDDIDIGSCTTVGSVVVPVALTFAAARESAAEGTVNQAQTLASVAAGYEAMLRLGRAAGGATLIYRGVWPTYALAAFASAAVVAVGLGLEPAATANALGVGLQSFAPLSRNALAQPAYRQFALGCAATDGWLAARAAQAGLTPAPDAVETFGAAIAALAGSNELDTAVLAADWPDAAVAMVDSKTFPTSRQALASIEAFRELLPLRVSDVAGIDVLVPAQYRDMVDQPAMPTSRLGSMLGVQYSMALAAAGSETLFDARRDALPGGALIEDWAAKVRVDADAELTRMFPQFWGGRVIVRLQSGERIVAEELEPRGSTAASLSWDAIEQKYVRIAAAGGCPECGPLLGELRAMCETFATGADGASAASLLRQAEAVGAAVLAV